MSSPPASSEPAGATPAMRQYFDAKRQYRDALVFFRMGDFYEMLDEDALTAARALELTLTARAKGAAGVRGRRRAPDGVGHRGGADRGRAVDVRVRVRAPHAARPAQDADAPGVWSRRPPRGGLRRRRARAIPARHAEGRPGARAGHHVPHRRGMSARGSDDPQEPRGHRSPGRRTDLLAPAPARSI